MLSVESIPICLVDGDIPQSFFDEVMSAGIVACDIETTGLDWKDDSIATFQMFAPDRQVVVVRPTTHPPCRISKLLKCSTVDKLFHHAIFDLRFIAHHWQVMAESVKCTKIASKLLRHDEARHSLDYLLKQHLGVDIDKTSQQSDWLREHLTEQQLLYAAKDVIYLPKLYHTLSGLLDRESLRRIAEGCYSHIPTQVWLEINGVTDVFEY